MVSKGKKNGVRREEIDLSQNRRNIFNVVQGPERQGWTETLWKISGIGKDMSHEWLTVLACILTYHEKTVRLTSNTAKENPWLKSFKPPMLHSVSASDHPCFVISLPEPFWDAAPAVILHHSPAWTGILQHLCGTLAPGCSLALPTH